MGITAKELALRLELSEAAVSMALNNKNGVSTATKKRVLEAAEKYGYDFTRVSARQGRAQGVYFIYYRKHGAIVNDNPFFAEISDSIQQACKDRGMRLNIRYLYEEDNIVRQIEDIVYSDCAGIILLGTEMHKEDFAPFDSVQVPIVLLDTYLEGVKRDCVLINNIQGAFMATDYLIRKTKRQPGYLRSSYPINNFDERADGFYKAVRHHGYSSSKSIVHRLSPSIDGAHADMMELLNRGESIAPCYFADNDMIALGVMKAFQKKGFSVPEDVCIVGFDNLPLCNYVNPGLTTVNVPKKYMGAMAVARLAELMTAKNFVPIKLEVQTNLVERQSV